MSEFTTKSGARVVINPASFKDAKELKKAIERQAAGEDIASLFSGQAFAALLKIDSSDEFDRALWPCLVRCTYNDAKIVESTFDDVEARKDYYDIVIACVKENIGPLFESLLSKFVSADAKEKQAKDAQK